MKLGFFASHGGSNMQAIINACKSGKLNAAPSLLISNNLNSEALKRAKRENIPSIHLNSKTHSNPEELDTEILNNLKKHKIDIIILAGYMRKIGPKVLEAYEGRILNIHPSLLPKFGGKGMYGMRVHEAVLAAGEKETGATVHLVNEEYDEGPVLLQSKVPILETDTAEDIAKRVLAEEHKLFVETLIAISKSEIILP